jgi:glycine cleavage system T protein
MATEKQQAGSAVPLKTVLYDWHRGHTGRLAEFAGYMMPLWYSSIATEHRAVRQAAGLFDVTHMGVLEVSGSGAIAFLQAITTNDVSSLADGQAQYSYMLDTSGAVLDDIIVYKLGMAKYMVVVNAANEAKVRDWLARIVAGEAAIDMDKPTKRLRSKPDIRDLRTTGKDGRVDLALQGPKSINLLTAAMGNDNDREQLRGLKSFHLMKVSLFGMDTVIARTGYTGAKTGYEIFVRPDEAVKLWEMLLERGREFGVEPCGLGARDSLRIEAGLPLYGHELDGELNISPFEAGYPWAVKLGKQFFIGRAAMREHAATYNRAIARMVFSGQRGVRPVRGGDAIVSPDGTGIGIITSAATVNETQYALALIERARANEGDAVGVYYLARNPGQVQQGRKEKAVAGEKLAADLMGRVVKRFERF